MAVIALTSLTGAPGVTTTAVAWAIHSPRPTLLIEADVVGGSPVMAGIWEGVRYHQRSILALASADVDQYQNTIWQHTRLLPQCTDRWVLPAIGSGVQAHAMAGVWSPLSRELARISEGTGIDILIDAGRLGVAGSAWPLIEGADAVLLMTDSTTPALHRLHVALPTLREELNLTGSHERLAVVPVLAPAMRTSLISKTTTALFGHAPAAGSPMRQPRRGNVAAATTPTRAIAGIRYNPRAASVYSDDMASSRFDRTYVADIERLIEATGEHVTRYRTLLEGTTR